MPALRDAALAHAQAAALARRFPEPVALEELARPPHDSLWRADSQVALRALLDGTLEAPAATTRAKWLLEA